MLTNLKRNRMGTTDFDAQWKGMRKPQSFVVYPIHQGQRADRLLVQSDTRIGWVFLTSGEVWLSKPHASGAYQPHLAEAAPVDHLTGEELTLLKSHVMASASGKAGTTGVIHTDNSGALDVFAG